jgi:hypothetical protein
MNRCTALGTWCLTLVLCPALQVGNTEPGSVAQAARLPLTLHVVSMADVSEPIISAAKKHVDDIFKGAGVEVGWDAGNGLRLTVILVEAAKIRLDPLGHGMKGLAIGNRGEGARRVYVFVDRIEEQAQKLFRSARNEPGAFDLRAMDREGTEAVILGIVIAHEVGHLLLPEGSHTSAGIMSAQMHNGDVDKAFNANLLFLPNQIELIRRVLTKNIYQSLETAEKRSADLTEKLRETVSLLRILWRQDFDSNYQKYMLGPSPTIVLIPREEMIRIAAARLDGRWRDGETTQGLTIGEEPDVNVFVVYDDIAPLIVARTINHEIGHLQLRGKGMSRNGEEAYVRKTADTFFFEKMFGRNWLKATVAAVKKSVMPVEKDGRQYQAFTPEAIETFYRQLLKAGTKLEKNPLNDRIVASLVFYLTNSEENLLAALDAEDGVN